jgi:hypothetical protein
MEKLWSYFLLIVFTQIHLSNRSWYNHRHYALTGVPQDDHSWPFSHSGGVWCHATSIEHEATYARGR